MSVLFGSALAALVSQVQKSFLTVHYFNAFGPIAQQAAWELGQAAVLDRLSLSVCVFGASSYTVHVNVKLYEYIHSVSGAAWLS